MVDPLTKAIAEVLKLPKNTIKAVITLSCDSFPVVEATIALTKEENSVLMEAMEKFDLVLRSKEQNG